MVLPTTRTTNPTAIQNAISSSLAATRCPTTIIGNTTAIVVMNAGADAVAGPTSAKAMANPMMSPVAVPIASIRWRR